MWGDGINDWIALSAADIGLSLFEAEPSLVASFTSEIKSIFAVHRLLRIGRSSLDLTFELVKYMIIFITIEFCSTWILYRDTSDTSDSQLIYYDIWWLFPIILFLCWTSPKLKLSPSLPFGHFINTPVILSLVGQTIIQSGCQIGAYFMLEGMDWFHHQHRSNDTHVHNYENTTIFL